MRKGRDNDVLTGVLRDQSVYLNRSHDVNKRSLEILKKLATRKVELQKPASAADVRRAAWCQRCNPEFLLPQWLKCPESPGFPCTVSLQ